VKEDWKGNIDDRPAGADDAIVKQEHLDKVINASKAGVSVLKSGYNAMKKLNKLDEKLGAVEKLSAMEEKYKITDKIDKFNQRFNEGK